MSFKDLIERNRATHKFAMPEPWHIDDGIVYDARGKEAITDCCGERNAKAIVQAHNDLPNLLACLERAGEGLKRIQHGWGTGPKVSGIATDTLSDIDRIAREGK